MYRTLQGTKSGENECFFDINIERIRNYFRRNVMVSKSVFKLCYCYKYSPFWCGMAGQASWSASDENQTLTSDFCF